MLYYFDQIGYLFLINYDSGSYYSGKACYEIESGFPQAKESSRGSPDSNTYRLITTVCKSENNVCLRSPFQFDLRNSPMELGHVYIVQQEVLTQLKKSLLKKKFAAKSKLYIIITSNGVKDAKTIEKELKETLLEKFTEVIFSRGWNSYGGEYITHYINCSTSPFIKENEKSALCKEISATKVLLNVITDNEDETKTGTIFLKDYKCKPRCAAGNVLHFNFKSYAFECKICENNTVKSYSGNGKSQQCLRGWLANRYKTMCFDTYINLSIRFTDESSVVMLSVSGMLLSGISSTIFLYIRYHETPVVKSSNLILSCIQLSSQLLLVIVMPFLFIGTPNTLIRSLRPVFVGLLLTISTSITLCKTRTLLRKFSSKRKCQNGK